MLNTEQEKKLNHLMSTAVEKPPMAPPEPLPDDLPELPPNAQPWSVIVLGAFDVLSIAYTHALKVLYQEGSNVVRYQLVSSNIVDRMLPILEHMETEGMPCEWIEQCARIFGPLVYELQVIALQKECEFLMWNKMVFGVIQASTTLSTSVGSSGITIKSSPIYHTVVKVGGGHVLSTPLDSPPKKMHLRTIR
jgi:hypothetical protein